MLFPLFRYCFATVSLLFRYCFTIVSQVFNNRFTIVPNILLCYNYDIVNKMGLVGLILGLEKKTMM